MEKDLFRKKSIERISSPEELNNYLRVTNPSVWTVLIAIIIVLAGMVVWSTVGTLETRAEGVVTVKNGEAEVVVIGNKVSLVDENDTIIVGDVTGTIDEVQIDEYGRAVGKAIMNLDDGKYKAVVVVESIQPISFLFKKN